MKLQSIVSITCAVRPWRCHDWCATRSQPLREKIKYHLSKRCKNFLFFLSFFSSQCCLKHFSTAASSSHPDSKNKKRQHTTEPFVSARLTDVWMQALTSRRRWLIEETSQSKFVCDGLGLTPQPPLTPNRHTHPPTMEKSSSYLTGRRSS